MKKRFDNRVEVSFYMESEKYLELQTRCGPTPLSEKMRQLVDYFLNGESVRAARSQKPPELLSAGECSREGCGHTRHKHGGFKGACQDDRCGCPGFKEA